MGSLRWFAYSATTTASITAVTPLRTEYMAFWRTPGRSSAFATFSAKILPLEAALAIPA
jgi:hypothetical protein